jgi:hypothetical protein
MLKPTRRQLFAASGALAMPQDVLDRNQAPPERKRLQGNWTPEKLAAALTARAGWKHFPVAADRDSWGKVPEAVRARCLADAEAALNQAWPVLPASLYLEYQRSGDRARFERPYRERRARLEYLAIAECIEYKGRFLDEIANGVWAICEESTWCLPAHISAQKAGVNLPDTSEPIVDLFAADTGSLLAWIWFLLKPALDKVSKVILPRIEREVRARVLAPYAQREDFWWMGLDPGLRRAMNNWNPWINSNCLTCILLMCDEPERSRLVHKVLRSVDRFIDSYHEDGGCDEGPGYWNHAGGSLFENLELLYSASGGKIDFYSMPLVAEIGRYIYRAHIGNQWYTNFADASARAHPQGDLIHRYGVRIKDEAMQAHGAYVVSLDARPLDSASSIDRKISAIFNWDRLRQTPPKAPLVRDVFLPQSHFFAARRRAGSLEGFYIAAQGGHNNESHNHNDVGNFILFLDGEPVLIDIGVETYTAKTFSSRRYEIWTMQSAWHNCPAINGVMQGAGRRFEATAVSAAADDNKAVFKLNLERAYPAEAGVRSWTRTLTLDRGRDNVSVEDRWALERPSLVEFSFITNRQVTASPGVVTIGGRAKLVHDTGLEAVIDLKTVDDARLRPVWGKQIARVRLTRKEAPAAGAAVFRIERV